MKARNLSTSVVIALAVGCFPAAGASSADAAEKRYPASLQQDRSPTQGSRAVRPVEGIAVHGVKSDRGIPDLRSKPRIPAPLRRWSRGGLGSADHWGAGVHEQLFRDPAGNLLTLATDREGLDLLPWARVLAATYHHAEIELVHVFVTDGATLREICGEHAQACYGPDDSARLFTGVMVVAYDDPDVVHSIFHEYGHHVDNQLYNLNGFRGCDFSSDGSRRWFFAREVADSILDRTACDPGGGWEYLLGELYAEDFAQLSGLELSVFDPRMPVGAPTADVRAALQEDMDDPFVPVSYVYKGTFRSKRAQRNLTLKAPSYVGWTNQKGVRKVGAGGCDFASFTNVFDGECSLSIYRSGGARKYRVRIDVY